MAQSNNPENFKTHIQEIDYNRILRILLSRWYWIVGCVFIGIIWAFVYLRFTPSVYETSALLKYDDKKTEISELININSYYDRKDKIQSETYVIQSRTLLYKAAIKLNYQYSFFRKGRILETESYPNFPFELLLDNIDSSSIFTYNFTISQLTKLKYKLTITNNGALISNAEYFYGQELIVGANKFRVIRPMIPDSDLDEFTFHFNHPTNVMGRLMGGLNVREVGKGINIMSLSFKSNNAVFASDALNAIISQYRVFDRDQKISSTYKVLQSIY